jgi:hypothetical protein
MLSREIMSISDLWLCISRGGKELAGRQALGRARGAVQTEGWEISDGE